MRSALAALLAALLAAAPAQALDKPRDWRAPALGTIPNHREIWRNVVIELATYAKSRNKNFVVLARGGVELAVKGDREAAWEELRDPSGKNFEKRLPVGAVLRPYVKALDGLVLDGLYCGPDAFGKSLDAAIKDRMDLDQVLAEERARGIYRPPVPQTYGPFSIDPKVELAKAAEVRRNAERVERQRRVIYAVDALRQSGRRLLSIDDCKAQKDVDAAYSQADRDRVLTYAATHAEHLDTLPKGHPRAENAQPISTITAARNWLPLLRSDRFGSRAEWVMAMDNTNQDILAIDVSHRGSDPLTKDDVKKLKYKALGSPRMVIAVMSVGKAFDWRWYWQKGWEAGTPSFLVAPEGGGVFLADVGNAKWKEMLGAYLAGIIDTGYDGVMLDDLDTYLWFEELMPLGG